jgi:hypothetical protein
LARAGAHVVTTSGDRERGGALRRRIATDVGANPTRPGRQTTQDPG